MAEDVGDALATEEVGSPQEQGVAEAVEDAEVLSSSPPSLEPPEAAEVIAGELDVAVGEALVALSSSVTVDVGEELLVTEAPSSADALELALCSSASDDVLVASTSLAETVADAEEGMVDDPASASAEEDGPWDSSEEEVGETLDVTAVVVCVDSSVVPLGVDDSAVSLVAVGFKIVYVVPPNTVVGPDSANVIAGPPTDDMTVK